ncbi:MAG: chromosomal replication initiator protein DnaA [Clostridia bacterium]|nr:chromosomal replication initiator protein DnaA [Clostridia bacterium]
MDENFINIWEKALEILKDETSQIAYKTYIEVMVPRIIDKNTICFLAPSGYHIEVCNKRYLDLIENTLKYLTSVDYKITFEAKDAIPEEGEEENLDVEIIKGQYGNIDVNNNSQIINNNPSVDVKTLKENAGLNPRYSFDNFIIGTNNRFAQATAYSVSQNLGLTNPLYIYGGVGLGKTHLMQAIGNAIIDKDPTKRVIYCTGELFVNELIKAMLNPSMNDSFKKKFRNVDLLLIDDVQIIAGKDKCQEEFFHTFNSLFESGKQIVLTSEKPPKEINGLEDRLKTRFSMGVSVDIQTPDYETRFAILKKKAEEERYLIDDEVLVKVATRVKSNVRELEGVFNKLMAYTKFTNSPLTDAVVDNIIESILVKNSKVLSSKLIMQVVAKFFNINVSDLTSDKRSNTIALPRQIAMYLCREVADMSFPAIGKDFGGRDHSTVLHAYSKIKDAYDSNTDTKDLIDDIKKTLERES